MHHLSQSTLLAVGVLTMATTMAIAQPAKKEHIIVAPHCLVKNVTISYKTLANTKDLTLLVTDEEAISQLMKAKNHQAKPCGGFIDVTKKWQTYTISKSKVIDANDFLATFASDKTTIAKPNAYQIKYPAEVNQLIGQINPQNLWTNLTTLTGYQDRYANSSYGVTAAHYFKTAIETLAKANNREDISVSLIKTPGYKQPSVIAKIGRSNAPGIVVGAHMDTLASWGENMPGADDDGSGAVTILEAARALISSNMTFNKPIYFIWYAAEEEGLLGSEEVVDEFSQKNIPIDAVIQFDLTGYAVKNDPTMFLMTDYVDKDLTSFLEKLISTYVKRPVKYTKCGYACSDHATWTQNGYVAALPAEAAFENTNPDIHSSEDTLANISLQHMTDYTKLAIAYAVELAEPKK